MKRNIARTGVLAAVVLSASCLEPLPSRPICIYTARSLGQADSELKLFRAAHPEVELRCAGAPEEYLYCPSRLADTHDMVRCKDQAAEDWVALRRPTAALADLLRAEGLETHADVLWGFGISHMWYFRENLRILRPYEPRYFDRVYSTVISDHAKGSLWRSFIEPEYWDSGAFTVPTAVGMDAFVAIFCVNTEKMRALDTSWDSSASLTWTDLVEREELRGKIVMPNPAVSGSGFVAVAGLIEGFKTIHGADEQGADQEAWEFLAQLDAAVALYTASGDGPCNLVASADNDHVIGITHDAADMLPHGDEPDSVRGVQRVFPAPDVARGGQRMLGYDVAANAQVEHGDASKPEAQVFLDWALSPEAVKSYAAKTPFVAYEVRDTPLPAGYPSDLERLAATQLNFNTIAQQRIEVQQRWLAEFCPESAETSQARCFTAK